MKYTFSDKRDITEAFPISSRRANDGDWKLFDIHDDEDLSACPGPQTVDDIRKLKVPLSERIKRFFGLRR